MKWYIVLLIAVAALLIGMWIANARNKKKGVTTMTVVPGTGTNTGTPTATTTTQVAA